MNTGSKAKINIFGSSTYGWLVTPSIRLEANSVLEFDLSFTKHNSSDKAAGNRDDDKFMVIVSTDNGTTWARANATVWSNDSTATHRLNNVSNIAIPFTVDLFRDKVYVKPCIFP